MKVHITINEVFLQKKKKIKQQLNKELISIASLCDIQGTNKQATGCT